MTTTATPSPDKQETLEEIAERCVREWVEHDLDEHFEEGDDFMITMLPHDLIERFATALRSERERCAKVAETDVFALVDYGGCCLECGEWTPRSHPERGEHKETCSWHWTRNGERKGDSRIAAAIREGR